MIIRRCFTIGTLILITPLLVILAPLFISVALIASLLPAFRTAPHSLIFVYWFVICEWTGLARFAWVWTLYRKDPSFMRRLRDIQFWWGQALFNLGKWVFQLEVEVRGSDSLEGPCAILLSRHTSMADTVLPLLYFGKTRMESLRYVLKQELQLLPCLDIGGNLLPNVFVDRSGTDSATAVRDVSDLVATAGDGESVLIYPEGTRFTQKKHDDLAIRRPNLKNQLTRWPGLLPPRLGGVSAMLEKNPQKDLVFLAHVGFEGSASIHDLLGGGWLKQRVILQFWRIPYSEIPTGDPTEFLFSEWDRMQRTVDALKADLAV
jgi:1-acyl-sn-glycerol-3-phosphate acyltransferase